MASTHQLLVGSSGTLSQIKAQCLKYNHDSSRHVKVSQNIASPKARYFSICYTAPTTGWEDAQCCRAHLKAIGQSRDEMEVVSVDLVHTCSNTVHHKRNYRMADISTVSNVLEVYQPTATKEGHC